VASTIPSVTVPTLVVHPTADTEIRRWQAREIFDESGAADKTYVELAGATHYLQGRRREAADLMIDWLRTRVP
jgi:alpha-beta hydrolase superfamily lysophospholipase